MGGREQEERTDGKIKKIYRNKQLGTIGGHTHVSCRGEGLPPSRLTSVTSASFVLPPRVPKRAAAAAAAAALAAIRSTAAVSYPREAGGRPPPPPLPFLPLLLPQSDGPDRADTTDDASDDAEGEGGRMGGPAGAAAAGWRDPPPLVPPAARAGMARR